MCGIFGVFRFDGAHPFENYEARMAESCHTLKRRGPDFTGFWSTQNSSCCLFHTRLSILDISHAGNQPFIAESGKHALCYNGEIYNFVELKRLITNVIYRSNCDTEVLLEGLVAKGTSFIRELDGMFSFGFYSKENHSLLLARDRMGQKPLYYTVYRGHFCFASDLRVFSKLPDFQFQFAVESVADYLTFQQVPAPRTIFRNIFKLQPGCLLRVDRSGNLRHETYLDPSHCSPENESCDEDSLQARLWEGMRSAIKQTLRADVELGCFLSGGIDSSLVSAFSRKIAGRSLRTFSVNFTDDPASEREEARQISSILGTDHTEVDVYPSDYLDLLSEVIDQFDEPNSDPSCIPTYKVSQVAKRHVDVVLTGDGLDELFGGYSRYLGGLNALSENLSAAKRGDWHLGIDYSRRIHPFHERHIQRLFGFLPPEFKRNLDTFYGDIDKHFDDPLRSLLNVDKRFYLPIVLSKVDKMSMAHSLEARSPFLSNKLISMSNGVSSKRLIRDGISKYPLRQMFSSLIDSKIAWLPKKGFANSPSNQIILFSVKERLLWRLRSENSLFQRLFGVRCIEMLSPFLESQSFYKLWSLLVLEEWIDNMSANTNLKIYYG